MFVLGKSKTIFFPSNTLIYGISRDGSKKFNICTCEHVILGQLRMRGHQTKNAPLLIALIYCHFTQLMWDINVRLVSAAISSTFKWFVAEFYIISRIISFFFLTLLDPYQLPVLTSTPTYPALLWFLSDLIWHFEMPFLSKRCAARWYFEVFICITKNFFCMF